MVKKIIIALDLICGLFLTVAGVIYTYYNTGQGLLAQAIIAVIVIVALDGLLYFLSAFGVWKNKPYLIYFSIILAAGNIVLSLTDQAGVADYSFMSINVLIVILTVLHRAGIKRPKKSNEN